MDCERLEAFALLFSCERINKEVLVYVSASLSLPGNISLSVIFSEHHDLVFRSPYVIVRRRLILGDDRL